VYDWEDALNMYEAHIVPKINDYYAMKEAQAKQGK
jgi:hypothetical protein